MMASAGAVEEFGDVGQLHLCVDIRPTDSAYEDEGGAARRALLVVFHMPRKPFARSVETNLGKARGEPGGLEMTPHPLGIGGATEAALGREVEGQHAAERHRFAVQQLVGKSRLRLQRVTEGVAEVE